jgi:hypothetical protein
MNARKDLLLIVLGSLLLLVGCAAWWLLIEGGAPGLVKPLVPEEEFRAKAIPELVSAPKGVAYPASKRADLDDLVKDWLSPEENEDGWNYDLFTTIDIVWDPVLKDYVPRLKKVIPLPPFGVALTKIGHPTYPYVLKSFLPGRSGKDEDREFFLENTETKEYFDRCKLKKPLSPQLNIIPVSYKQVKSKDKDGFTITRNVLTLDDKVLGQLVEIDDVKVLEFTDRTNIELVSTSDPSKTWTFHGPGDKFTYKEAHYVIKHVDLDAKSVTLDKTFTLEPKKPKKTITEVLTIAPPAPAAPPATKSKTPSTPATPTK